MDDAAYILENASSSSLVRYLYLQVRYLAADGDVQVLLDEFGRGTTADYAACIAESTIHALANEVKARSLFATHLHDVHDIIHENSQLADAKSIKFFCTRLSVNAGTSVEYLYQLVPGINRDAEAFTVCSGDLLSF
jgi:DNA mismatch repair ATPase MutS